MFSVLGTLCHDAGVSKRFVTITRHRLESGVLNQVKGVTVETVLRFGYT